MTPDLDPPWPLPSRGDRVRVLVSSGARVAPDLVAPGPAPEWCRVVEIRTGPYDLYPVVVRLPGGGLGAYQQHEIAGWQPSMWRHAVRHLRARVR